MAGHFQNLVLCAWPPRRGKIPASAMLRAGFLFGTGEYAPSCAGGVPDILTGIGYLRRQLSPQAEGPGARVCEQKTIKGQYFRQLKV